MATDSWIALSSRYYMDEKLSGCSAGVERMFTRLLAYCRLADTGGNVPENAHILVQLPRQKSDVIALETRGILVPNSDRPGWHFPAWPDWQEKGDALQQRRKSDRERKRRQRQGVTGQSRDVSHGNPHLP